MEPYIINLLTFSLGLILGHRLTLGRDLRKEFNEITNEAYFNLRKSIDSNSIGGVSIDNDRIEHYIPWYSKRHFRECVERYKNSQGGVSQYCVETSTVTVDEAAKTKMLKCAADVLHYLKPR